MMKVVILLYCLVLSSLSFAANTAGTGGELYPFDNSVKQQQFQKLTRELRCLVCQNQNLEDSHAPLAADLRQQIYTQLRSGESPQAVVDYLVARYGDFVLYQPPMQANTYLLWFFPLLLLALGIIALFMLLRGMSRRDPTC